MESETVALDENAPPASVQPARLPASERFAAWADRHRVLFLGAVVVLYLLGFNGRWRIEPDSALYLSIARNLAEGRGFRYLGQPNNLVYPGLPWLVAGTFELFGSAALWPANLLMMLSGLATLGLVYRTFRLHAGRPVAVVVTLGTALTFTFYRYAYQIMTDMPFLLGVMAFFCGYEELLQSPPRTRTSSWLLMISGLALALLMRPTAWVLLPVLVVVGVVSLFQRRAGKTMLGVLALIVVACGVFLALNLNHVRTGGATHAIGSYEEFVFNLAIDRPGEMLHQIVVVNIPHVLDEIMTMASFGFDLPLKLNWPLGVVLIVLGVGLVRVRLAWGLWVAATVAMMLLIIATDRYLLAVMPFLVYGWWRGMSWVNRRLRHPFGDWAFAAMLALSIVPNAVKVGGLVIEQHRSDFLAHYKDGRFLPILAMADQVARHVGEDDLVLAPHRPARILAYYSRRAVVGAAEPRWTDPQARPRFVVLDPADEEERARIAALGVALSEPIETIPRPKQPPLTLHPTK